MNHLILVTFSDCKRICRIHKEKIRCGLIAGMLIALCAGVLKEPQFLAQSSVKYIDVDRSVSLQVRDISQLMTSSPQSFSKTTPVPILLSNTLLKDVVEQMGMQVELQSRGLIRKGIGRIWDNCRIELLCGLKELDLPSFNKVHYHGEKPLKRLFKRTGDRAYQILGEQEEVLWEGELGQQAAFSGVEMVVSYLPATIDQHKVYPLVIQPWVNVVKKARKCLQIKPDQEDKQLLLFSFLHRNRNISAQFLNQLAASYLKIQKREKEKQHQLELAFLEKREKELSAHFEQILGEYGNYLADNVLENGCLNLEEEFNTLSKPIDAYKTQLFSVDLNLSRHQSAPQEKKNIDESGDLFLAEMSEEGLSLEQAQKLYGSYIEQRDSLQGQLRQMVHLRDQMTDPEFQLSSLETVFSDSVMRDLIHKASSFALNLNDEENRTLKEQERLREYLQTQKKFASEHLFHSIELIKMRLKLMDSKIAALQQHMVKFLFAEKTLLENKLGELRDMMKNLPGKWKKEHLLILKKELSAKMIEVLMQLSEARRISNSVSENPLKMVDAALPPLKPKHPYLILLTCAGALLGCFLTFFYYFCRALLKGFPLSYETLKMLKMQVFGTLSCQVNRSLSELSDRDLDALRQASEFIHVQKRDRQALLVALVGGDHPDYSHPFAELLAMRGQRILVIQHLSHPDESTGLSHYLQNEVGTAPIHQRCRYDYISSGGMTRYATEWLYHPRFTSLIAECRLQYDLILLYSTALPNRAEGHAFINLADAVIVTAHDETQDELYFYEEWAKRKGAFCTGYFTAEEAT
jgi:hypothetical protein